MWCCYDFGSWLNPDDVATVIICEMSIVKTTFLIPKGGVSETVFLETKMGQ